MSKIYNVNYVFNMFLRPVGSKRLLRRRALLSKKAPDVHTSRSQ